MEYLADTVAIVRHFSGSKKIGKKTKEIFNRTDQGEHTIYISIFSMVEIMYLSEKEKIPVNFSGVKSEITESDNYHVIDLNIEIVETARKIGGLELHDRLIVATADYLGVPILTSDQMIRDSGSIESIWD